MIETGVSRSGTDVRTTQWLMRQRLKILKTNTINKLSTSLKKVKYLVLPKEECLAVEEMGKDPRDLEEEETTEGIVRAEMEKRNPPRIASPPRDHCQSVSIRLVHLTKQVNMRLSQHTSLITSRRLTNGVAILNMR